MHSTLKEGTERRFEPRTLWCATLALLAISLLLALSGASPAAAGSQVAGCRLQVTGLTTDDLQPFAGSRASSSTFNPSQAQGQTLQPVTIRGHVLLPGRPVAPDPQWVVVVTGT